MIFRSIGPQMVFYRFHSPRWADRPLSGKGSALQGGRFNRPGIEALFLSTDIQTAQAEYQQEASLMPPATVTAYRITLGQVIDLSAGYDPSMWGPEWEDWNCDWRAMAFAENIEPPSWALGDLARTAGARGILFPSLKRRAPDALNLAIFTTSVLESDELQVHDPRGDLPRNQDSWKPRA